MFGSSGWWNWSITCGSGGPKRRAKATNSRGVSFCPRSTSTWPRKNAGSSSANVASSSGSETSTSDVSSPKPAQSGLNVSIRNAVIACIYSAARGPSYFRNSGRINRGRNSGISGQTISMASTSSIGTSMIIVSLSA